MGVPSFYRWLVRKYPKVVVRAIEENWDDSSPNPNGEFDNLYLDMNGIIHPCFHPDDHVSPPTTFEEVFESIFEYIDRLFNIVRPRKLLYMAIDGVAPRAKMNQQRSRRFRTAKDNEICEAEERRLREEFEREVKPVLPKLESEVTDSNVITPGTKFMHALSKALQVYINDRLNNNAVWKNIKVILSDSNVHGEGEHKIMSFIRLQRACPNYDPNTCHCLYGLDADLIMLALATHEVHFSILREDVLQEQNMSCQSVPNTTLLAPDSNPLKSRARCKPFVDKVNNNASLIKKPYEFMQIWILREYLQLDMNICDLPKSIKDIDFERIVDDFIFLCFFAGNDFLPHMPTLEIHEGAIDLLMSVYIKEFKNLGGYLINMEKVEDTKGAYINLKRVEKFILLVGAYEERIFKKRSELLERKLRRIIAEHADARDEEEDDIADIEPVASTIVETTLTTDPLSSDETEILNTDNHDILEKNTKELKERLREYIRSQSDLFKSGGLSLDKVRLGQFGWKERYYKHKFSAESNQEIESIRNSLVQSYTEGLCWVLLYYFSGVPSWTWFYPYHYGPFASDLKGLSQVKVNFQRGSPFRPFDQLMAVLPPRSVHALPKAYQSLMTDESSNIVDFYPKEFEVDTDGKRYMWQGICKLSFIDENRLQSETRKLEKELKEDELVRNATGADRLYVTSSSELGKGILLLQTNNDVEKPKEMVRIDTILSDGFNGYVGLYHRNSYLSTPTFPGSHCGDILNEVLYVFYKLPDYQHHIPRVLEGVEYPEKTVTEDDIEETSLWHEDQGNRPSRPYQQRHRKAANVNAWKSKSSDTFVPTMKPDHSGWCVSVSKEQVYPMTSSIEHNMENGRMPFQYSSKGRMVQGSSYSVEHNVNGTDWKTNSTIPLGAQTYGGQGAFRGRGGSRGQVYIPTSAEHSMHGTMPLGYRGRGGVNPGSYSVEQVRHNGAHQSHYSYGAAAVTSSINSNPASFRGVSQTKSWKAVVSSNIPAPTGFNNLTISGSTPGAVSYGSSQPRTSNNWPQDNGVSSYGNNRWQQSLQPGVPYYSGCEGGQSTDGNFIWRQSSPSGVPYDGNTRWGQSSQPGMPYNRSNQWQQGSQPGSTSAARGHHGWQPRPNAPTSNSWQHSPRTTSTQGRGRGKFVSRTSDENWRCRDSSTGYSRQA